MKKLFLNISEDQRDKISLALKLVLYFFVLVWDLLFISAAVFFFPQFLEACPRFGILSILPTWYVITFILIAIWVAAKGFRVIGKWEYQSNKK